LTTSGNRKKLPICQFVLVSTARERAEHGAEQRHG
jgi:hypothetical protein